MCLIISFLLYLLAALFFMTFVFPLPVNDAGTVRYRSVPWTTVALIFINTAIFVLWLAPDLYQNDEALFEQSLLSYVHKVWSYGFREKVVRDGAAGAGAFTTFSSMFMHADIWHLFGNMVYLWAFGRRVEDACGHWRYLAFYLFAGMVANVGSAVLSPGIEDRPGIGASGAIAGVMGAYLLLFPSAYIVTLWGLGSILRIPVALVRILTGQNIPLWRWTVPLPAWFLLIGFALQNAIPSMEVIMGRADTGGINYLAHLAGFLAALAIFLFVRKDLLMRYISGRSL
jgi:membrane associated rhomboid family serine protease